MNDQQWFDHHLNCLQTSFKKLQQQPELANPQRDDDHYFIDNVRALIEHMSEHQSGYYEEGQDVVLQWIRLYPQHSHLLDRDLLWFFGGDCLQYLDDEEIDFYQRMEDYRYAAQEQGLEVDYASLKARFGKEVH